MSAIARSLFPCCFRPRKENDLRFLETAAGKAEQIVAGLAVASAVALTTADLAKGLIGIEKIGFTAAAGVTVGASKAILEGLRVIPSTVRSLTNELPGEVLAMLLILEEREFIPSGIVLTAAVFYTTLFLGVIAGSGAKIALNKAGWNETIVATTISFGGLVTAACTLLDTSPLKKI